MIYPDITTRYEVGQDANRTEEACGAAVETAPGFARWACGKVG